ncbi:hypothetical protein ACFY89_29095 [Achromobacter spanius]|uniref:hypothetical protein n=1 Tax=Achromobacter spanius TaxID=217203 RepID=UPI0036E651F6
MPVTEEEAMAAYKELRDFVTSPPFEKILDELNAVDPVERPQFVAAVLLDPSELEKRNVFVPEDMTVQRTVFADGRPTLFCVTKYLSDGSTKATITFDNPEL